MTTPLANWHNLQRGYTHGKRTFYGTKHRGVDLIVPTGTSLRAPEAGTIRYRNDWGGGIWIIVVGSIGEHWFAHLSKRAVPAGASVRAGQVIAYTGNTGAITTAPHLHYQLLQQGAWIDPEPYYRVNSKDMISRLYALDDGRVVLAVGNELWHIKDPSTLDNLYEGAKNINPVTPDYIKTRKVVGDIEWGREQLRKRYE